MSTRGYGGKCVEPCLRSVELSGFGGLERTKMSSGKAHIVEPVYFIQTVI